jgi:hypothetical protein
MNTKTLNTKILLLAALMAASQTAWAGKLDLDYAQTSPTRALVYGLDYPSGGHFYLAARDPKYKKKGYLFLALGIISGAFMFEELKKGSPVMAVTSGLLAGGVKIWEFSSSTTAAETERLKWFRAHFKETDDTTSAERTGTSPAGKP